MKKYLFVVIFFFCSTFLYSQSPELWGTMQAGGPFGIGSIVRIHGDGTGFERVYSFSTGSPWCTLLPSGGSLIYGMTASGGSHSLGDIFSYNSSTGVFTSLFSLDSINGYYPNGSLIMASDNKLYGVTTNGGTHDLGVVFSFNPSGNLYTKLHDFDNISGQYPTGSLMQASNGKLYGMASTGGVNGSGLIFSYDITNNSFTDVHDFEFSMGFTPFGNLIEATNHLLYGMVFGGGTTGYGVIFSFDPTNGNYSVIHNFNGTDGSAPFGTVIQGSNSLLYGCTSQGGVNNVGVIFSIDVAGATFTKLHDFVDSTGSKPWGNVMQASDGNLYGMTAFGGASDLGAIYSYNLSTNIYTKLHDCDFTDGAFPYADLIEYHANTGIGETTGETLLASVYPDPSDGHLTIEIPNAKYGEVSFTLSDLTGMELQKTIFTQSTTSLFLDYPAGIYFASLRTKEGSVTKKVVIR